MFGLRFDGVDIDAIAVGRELHAANRLAIDWYGD
jgi:hypothetical protein